MLVYCIQVLKVCKKIVHAGFDGSPHHGNDIALLVLKDPAKIHKPIVGLAPISDCGCLSAFGWFKSSPNGGCGSQLEVLPDIEHVNATECEVVVGELPQRVICAATPPARGIHCEWNQEVCSHFVWGNANSAHWL